MIRANLATLFQRRGAFERCLRKRCAGTSSRRTESVSIPQRDPSGKAPGGAGASFSKVNVPRQHVSARSSRNALYSPSSRAASAGFFILEAADIVLTDDAKYTLPVALANLVGEHVQDTELMMAGSVLTVLPVLLVFLALQRVYIKGALMGSVKG